MLSTVSEHMVGVRVFQVLGGIKKSCVYHSTWPKAGVNEC